MADVKENQDRMADRLSQLGEEFNTNPEFGMMGYLKAQEQSAVKAEIPDPAPADPEPTPEEPKEDPIAPLYSSIRTMEDRLANRFSSEIGAIKQAIQPREDFAQEIDPVQRETTQLRSELDRVKLNQGYDKAKNSLNLWKVKHPDFDYSEQDLQTVWSSYIGNDTRKAEGSNWDEYFKTQYESRSMPKKIKALEQELSTLKNKNNSLNDLSAIPRGNRQGPSSPQAVTGDFDEDIYKEAIKGLRKGQFKGMNRALVAAQNKKLLRSAS